MLIVGSIKLKIICYKIVVKKNAKTAAATTINKTKYIANYYVKKQKYPRVSVY